MKVLSTPGPNAGDRHTRELVWPLGWVWVLTCIQVLPQDFWMIHSMHIVFVVCIWKYWTYQQSSAVKCDNILFFPILGCDTTSRLYDIGNKIAGLKLITDNEDFRQLAQIFESSNSSNDQMVESGEKALVILYRGKETDVLDTMRLQRFQELVTVSIGYTAKYVTSYIHCSKVSPLRVFHQVQYWKENFLNGEEWGWQFVTARW